jgi:hypothetical protein
MAGAPAVAFYAFEALTWLISPFLAVFCSLLLLRLSLGLRTEIDLVHGKRFFGVRFLVNRPAPINTTSKFAVFPGLLRPNEVEAILKIVRKAATELAFDVGPDSVDQMTAHEIFIDNVRDRDRRPV